MIGHQIFRRPVQRHKVFKSLTPQDISVPLHEIGKILCNKDCAYTPSMWAAYFEEWVNAERQPKGYTPRGRDSPPLSANLEESILASGEAEVLYCDYTDDVGEYLRGKYGLFPAEIWAEAIFGRREMLQILCVVRHVIQPCDMRLHNGDQLIPETPHDSTAGDPPVIFQPGKAWSRYWPATHGHQVPLRGEAKSEASRKRR